MYPALQRDWCLPTDHEREIKYSRVNEIFYEKFFIALLIGLIIIPVALRLNILVIIPILSVLFLILFPVFIRPWELVLTNKRLIMRHQYWNIGRFSTMVSFNLDQLDSQRVTPRIKVIPITLGFTIIFSYSLTLVDFYLTKELPVPLIFKVLYLFSGFFPVLQMAENRVVEVVEIIFAPFLGTALLFALISGVIGVGLILFGLPRRTKMILTTTGGHQFSLNTGIPEELTDYLYAIGRKHRIEDLDDMTWNWDLPLLDDETVRTQSSVGLIDRTTQVLGLIYLVLFIDSVDQLIRTILDFSISAVVILLLRIIDFFFIYIAISLAKKYTRITATNHRIIYQEERKEISGLWGKRIYRYYDLPYRYLQGFSYSNFAGLAAENFVGLLIIYFGGLALSSFYQSSLVFGFTIIAVVIYILFNYKTFVFLEFKSIGGDRMLIWYRIPTFMAKLSHRFEGTDWAYNRFFPNVLSEKEIVTIANSIRNVEKPRFDAISEHEIRYLAFVDEKEEILEKWEKIGPFRYSRFSIILGILLTIVSVVTFWYLIDFMMKGVFIIISAVFGITAIMRNVVFTRHSLVLLDSRLFHIREILPRRIALLFGILPERTLTEVDSDFVLVSRFHYFFGNKVTAFLRRTTILLILGVIIFEGRVIETLVGTELHGFVILIASVIFVSQIPITVRYFFMSLPRYGLEIYTRFGNIKVPYITGLERYNYASQEVKI